MPESQEGKSQQDLLSKAEEANTFSQLTYLLRLVTAINLNDNLHSSFHECRNRSPEGMEDPSHSQNVTILDSIVAILVQQHEVVAACYTSDKVSVVVAETDPSPSTDTDILVESPPPGSHELYTLELATVSNPDFNSSDNANLNANPHNLQILTDSEGKNLWTSVRDLFEWYCVLMGPGPLINHVTTVSAYLNDYKSQTDPKKQDLYSRKFTSYLLSTCWEKIVRRIKSWQAMGFIHILTNIVPTELEHRGQKWERFPTCDGAGDKTLKDFLHHCRTARPELIKSLILDNIPSSLGPDIEGLLAVINTGRPLFSSETIQEFHSLVTSAFTGFAVAFLRIKKYYSRLSLANKIPIVSKNQSQNLNDKQKKLLSAFKRALLHNRLLLTLLSSNAFKTYFEMLANFYGERLLPARQQIPFYRDFEKTLRLKIDPEDTKLKPDVQLAQEEEGDTEEGDEEEGFEEGRDEEEGRDIFLFLRFLKTLVVHFTAKRALERYCFRIKDHEVKFALFSLERSPLAIPTGSWPKDMIRTVFPSDPSSTSTNDTPTAATKAFEILERKVLKRHRDDSKFDKLLAGFEQVIKDNKPIILPGGLHCETVLATLGKFYEDFLTKDKSDDNAKLISTCKRLLQSGMISVSKLCCPVCWELLGILNNLKDDPRPLSFPGCHPIIYPVELPAWLPRSIVEDITERFRGHLRRELDIMVQGVEQKDRIDQKKRHASHESESNISVASTTRDDSREDPAFTEYFD